MAVIYGARNQPYALAQRYKIINELAKRTIIHVRRYSDPRGEGNDF